MLCVNIDGTVLSEEDLETLKKVFENQGILREDTMQFYKNLQQNEYKRRYTSMSTFIKTRFSQILLGANSKMTTENKLWNSTLANVWSNMYAPSRPSKSELNCYQSFFNKVRNNALGDNPSVLIMGSTPEFRELASKMGFDTVVVDYNKEYYEEISKALPVNIIQNEKLVVCDWAEMDNCPYLSEKTFDIIIGDLAIGNIKPSNLKKVFSAIRKLLRRNGYFLGKNLYSFSRDEICEHSLHTILSDYFSGCDQDTPENAYAHTMYPLSIFATQKRKERRIDFDLIYNKVKELCESNGWKDSAVYRVYCGENTSFKEKLELDFYTYPIHEIIDLLQSEHLYFVDTDYGTDAYSDKFPLLILQKIDEDMTKVEDIRHACFSKIGTYTKRHNTDKWAKYVSAQYFVAKICSIYTKLPINQWNSAIRNIKSSIISTIKVGISDDLVCFIDSYFDERIEDETVRIKNVEELTNDKDKLIGETYTLAVLLYLTSSLSDNYNDINSVYNLVAEKLFNLPGPGELWQPEEAPWIRAKICLAVADVYKSLKEEYQEKIEDTLDWIINQYDERKSQWDCAVGSYVDTKALCCEVLLIYYPLTKSSITKRRIVKTIYQILDSYVMHGKIYETCALYPIGECVINHILNDDTLRGKPFGKKLTTRIEFLSILLRLISFAKENINEFRSFSLQIDLSSLCAAELFLTKRLVQFWSSFEANDREITDHLTSTEISAVLQIIYSLAEALKD